MAHPEVSPRALRERLKGRDKKKHGEKDISGGHSNERLSSHHHNQSPVPHLHPSQTIPTHPSLHNLQALFLFLSPSLLANSSQATAEKTTMQHPNSTGKSYILESTVAFYLPASTHSKNVSVLFLSKALARRQQFASPILFP
jgi:hypothetical protein